MKEEVCTVKMARSPCIFLKRKAKKPFEKSILPHWFTTTLPKNPIGNIISSQTIL